eukprot:g4957.t1
MTNRIYIGHLSSHTRDRDLDRAFGRYGRIEKIDVRMGFAFIEFEDRRDAEDAVAEMDGREFDGARIVVQPGRGHRPNGPKYATRRTEHRITVEGLDSHTSWQDLKDFGRQAGQVLYSDVFFRQGRRWGVVEYVSRDDMKNAIRTLDDTRLGGKYIRVREENSGRDSRSRSRSRSRRRSRSYSRSPPSRRRDRDRSFSPDERGRGRGRARDDSRSRSRSRSRSPARHSRSRSRHSR